MLAKVWKKLLLAICIVACIYNIMSKLVNRNSLEANLKKANDGNTVFDFSSKTSTDVTPEIVNTQEIKNTTVQADGDSVIQDEENVVTEETEEPNNNEEEKDKSGTVKFSDFIFKW